MEYVTKGVEYMYCIKTEKGYVNRSESTRFIPYDIDFYGSVKHSHIFFTKTDAINFIEYVKCHSDAKEFEIKKVKVTIEEV